MVCFREFLLAGTLTVIVSGCTTTATRKVESNKKGIMDAYLSGVKKSDGINQQEAVLLAQSQLIFRGDDKRFYIDKPEITLEDERSWRIRFYSLNKTWAEVSASSNVLILVDKKNGNTRWQKEE